MLTSTVTTEPASQWWRGRFGRARGRIWRSPSPLSDVAKLRAPAEGCGGCAMLCSFLRGTIPRRHLRSLLPGAGPNRAALFVHGGPAPWRCCARWACAAGPMLFARTALLRRTAPFEAARSGRRPPQCCSSMLSPMLSPATPAEFCASGRVKPAPPPQPRSPSEAHAGRSFRRRHAPQGQSGASPSQIFMRVPPQYRGAVSPPNLKASRAPAVVPHAVAGAICVFKECLVARSGPESRWRSRHPIAIPCRWHVPAHLERVPNAKKHRGQNGGLMCRRRGGTPGRAIILAESRSTLSRALASNRGGYGALAMGGTRTIPWKGARVSRLESRPPTGGRLTSDA